MIGRLQDAHKLLEYLLSLRNELGLLAEEYDTERHRQVGNFPQAFSHIAMVNAIFDVVGDETGVRHSRGSKKVPAAPKPKAEHSDVEHSELDPQAPQNMPRDAVAEASK